MKTIEVTDEMYKALMELSKEMVSQDPRHTRMPHNFQVREEVEVAAYPGNGVVKMVRSGEDEVDFEGIYEAAKQVMRDNGDSEEEIEEYFDAFVLDTDDAKEILIDAGYWEVEVETAYKFHNTFLTAKACEEHIEANKHHYTKPICYLNHAWRNPEMELVSKFLCELSGGKLHT